VQAFKETGFWLHALLRCFGTLERLGLDSHAGAWERSNPAFESVEAAPVVDETPHDIRAMREHLNLPSPGHDAGVFYCWMRPTT